jgi:glyoxylate reductase
MHISSNQVERRSKVDKQKVVITRKIPQDAIELLEQKFTVYIWESESVAIPRDVLLEQISDSSALLCMVSDKIDRQLMEAAPRLSVISTLAVGVDNIDLGEATKRGIKVGHTPDVLTETTADLAFALLIATSRRLGEAISYIKDGKWTAWSPLLMAGRDLYGSTLGIIGMGRIGEAVARRAAGFSMNVLYHNRSRNLNAEETLGVSYRTLEMLLKEADHVLLLAPGSPQTHHMIGEDQFSLMKPTATFINVSRGSNVDEEALSRALSTGQIWAAGLDVFEKEPVDPANPLLSLDKVVALPHIGSASMETRLNMALLAARNILAGFEAGRLIHTANPDVYQL